MMLFSIFLTLPRATEQSHSLSLSYHFYHKNQTESFKQSTRTLYAFELLLFKRFINACKKLTGVIPVDWTFSLGV